MKRTQRGKRRTRVRTSLRKNLNPRLSVYKSNKYLYAQIIDDLKGTTLLGVSEKDIPQKDIKSGKIEKAKALGNLIAQKAKMKKVTAVVFDRGSYSYHGAVKALAEGAREGGLKF